MSETRPVEIKALAGARAVPPLILILFHFCEGHGYRGLSWFDFIAAKGYLWVEFFFALSGFILVHVYGSRTREFWRGKAYPAFLFARLARLYPLHLFMMFAILAQCVVFRGLASAGGYVSIFDQPYHPVLTWQTFVANLFLVQAWNVFNYLSWNGIAWYVSVEFLLCLCFPLYLLIPRGGVLAGLASCVTGIAGLVALDLTSRHGLDLTFHNGIWRGMAAFAIGVGLACVFRAAKRSVRPPLPEVVHSTVQLALLAALLWAIWFTGWSHTHRDILTVLPMFGLVFALAFDRGLVAAALKTGVTRRLGDWSYAIFIGQTFWLQFDRFSEQRLFPQPSTIVFGVRWVDLAWWTEPALLVLVCIGWGALLSQLVERPASNALKQLLARHDATPTTPA